MASRHISRAVLAFLILNPAVSVCLFAQNTPVPQGANASPALRVSSVIDHQPFEGGFRDQPTTTRELILGDDIRLQVDNLSDWIKAGNSPWNLVLFLNERPMNALHPVSVDEKSGYLTFRLQRLDENIPAWEGLMSRGQDRKLYQFSRPLRASVGPQSGVAAPSTASFVMVFLPFRWLIFVVAVVISTAWLLLVLARKTALLRSSASGPYSLGRTQMALWSWLTLNAYLYLFALTHDPGVEVPVSVLGLLGISAGTYVAAVMVDLTSGSSTPEPSYGFLRDIAGGADVSLHRLQMIGWTSVFAIAFIAEVLDRLSIPDFNPTLLGLMGLSAGTYVGFKFPENQGAQTPSQAASTAAGK